MQINNRTVSIITPLYNAEEFISETAESVLSQTYRDFEWLIVNDSSLDSSKELLDALAEKDERVRVLHLEENHGPIYARNYGFERATGRYIALLDADDLWLPEKLELQLELMDEKQAAISCTKYKKIDREGNLRSGFTLPMPARASYNRILHSDCIMTSSALYDRNLTGDVRQDESIPVGRDDLHFFLEILREHKYIYCVNKDLGRRRIFGETITGNKLNAAKMQWKFYRETMHLNVFSSFEKFVVYAVKGFLKHLM